MRVLVVIAFVFAAAGCSDNPTASDCENLLDHTVRIELAETGPAATDDQVNALKAATREAFIEECTSSLPRDRFDCGMKAKTKKDQRACDDG